MRSESLLEALVELAQEAGLTVRRVGPGRLADLPLPATSAVCRVRGGLWLVLSDADPVERRIEVAAAAVRTHAQGTLEGRFLPPAVRERLEEPDGPGVGDA